MIYKKIKKGKFINRPNRFIANVEIDGKVETVHVKNTGRCKELLINGVTVILEESSNPNRKTKYDLVCVYKQNFGLINMDSQAPNVVMKEWLLESNFTNIKSEFTYGNSRIDFMATLDGKDYLIEAKGCTLEIDGIGYFPDAPTERGIKHIKELIKSIEDGYVPVLAFVIQMKNIKNVLPNMKTHPEFGEVLSFAKLKGVKIWYMMCDVEEDSLKIISKCV